MAGHLKICELNMNEEFVIRQMGMWCNATIHNAVGKVIRWLNKTVIAERHLPDKPEWHEYFIGRRKVRVLPKDYAREDYIALDMGELPVGKKITCGGYANFEVHYNKKTNHAIIYLVA